MAGAFGGVRSKNIIINIIANIKSFRKGMQKVNKDLDDLKKNVKGNITWGNRLGKTMGVMGQKFQAWALGIMFGGMAIQRAFGNILKSGVDTFLKIAESNNFANTAIQRFNASMTFLKFSVGEAMNKFLEMNPQLEDMIHSFGIWIQRNKELFARFVILGFVIGTLLMVVGMFVLFIWGLIGAMISLNTVAGILGVSMLAAFGIIIVVVIVVIAIVALLTFLIIKYWDQIKAFSIKVWENIKDRFIKAFTTIKNFVATVFGWIKKQYDRFLKPIFDAVDRFASKMTGGNKNSGNQGGGNVIGSRARGGYISQTGPYLLHSGETVNPAGGSTNFGSVNITVNTTGGVDASAVADRLMKEIKRYTNIYPR
jgi:hypothetical protein|tara:strand:+ start:23000 stop:24103 length:1104 start_codon:yes stop_codon:yes gene_type:complete